MAAILISVLHFCYISEAEYTITKKQWKCILKRDSNGNIAFIHQHITLIVEYINNVRMRETITI